MKHILEIPFSSLSEEEIEALVTGNRRSRSFNILQGKDLSQEIYQKKEELLLTLGACRAIIPVIRQVVDSEPVKRITPQVDAISIAAAESSEVLGFRVDPSLMFHYDVRQDPERIKVARAEDYRNKIGMVSYNINFFYEKDISEEDKIAILYSATAHEMYHIYTLRHFPHTFYTTPNTNTASYDVYFNSRGERVARAFDTRYTQYKNLLLSV